MVAIWYAIMLLSGSSWCRLYDTLNSLDQWRLRANAYKKIVGAFCLNNCCFSWSKYSITGHMKLIICGKMFTIQFRFWEVYQTLKLGGHLCLNGILNWRETRAHSSTLKSSWNA